MNPSRTLRIVTRATTLVAAATYGAALIVGMQGPGGVQGGIGIPATQPALDTLANPECSHPDRWTGKAEPAKAMILDGRLGTLRKVDYLATYYANVDDDPTNNRIVVGWCA